MEYPNSLTLSFISKENGKKEINQRRKEQNYFIDSKARILNWLLSNVPPLKTMLNCVGVLPNCQLDLKELLVRDDLINDRKHLF